MLPLAWRYSPLYTTIPAFLKGVICVQGRQHGGVHPAFPRLVARPVLGCSHGCHVLDCLIEPNFYLKAARMEENVCAFRPRWPPN